MSLFEATSMAVEVEKEIDLVFTLTNEQLIEKLNSHCPTQFFLKSSRDFLLKTYLQIFMAEILEGLSKD